MESNLSGFPSVLYGTFLLAICLAAQASGKFNGLCTLFILSILNIAVHTWKYFKIQYYLYLLFIIIRYFFKNDDYFLFIVVFLFSFLEWSYEGDTGTGMGKSSVFHNLATALYTHYNDYYACYNISELTKNSAKIIFKVQHSR